MERRRLANGGHLDERSNRRKRNEREESCLVLERNEKRLSSFSVPAGDRTRALENTTSRGVFDGLHGAGAYPRSRGRILCLFCFLGAGVATANFTYPNHSQMTRVFMCLYHVLQDDFGNDLPCSILFKSTDLIQSKGLF